MSGFFGNLDGSHLCNNNLLPSVEANHGHEVLSKNYTNLFTSSLGSGVHNTLLSGKLPTVERGSAVTSTVAVPSMFQNILESSAGALDNKLTSFSNLNLSNPVLDIKPFKLQDSLSKPSSGNDSEGSNWGSSTKPAFHFDPSLKFSASIFDKPSAGLQFHTRLDQLELDTERILQPQPTVGDVLKRALPPSDDPCDKGEVPRAKCPKYEITVKAPPEFRMEEESLESAYVSELNSAADPAVAAKFRFVNAVSGSLIEAPNFKSKDDHCRATLVELAGEVADRDPEFVLKVALYARQDLFIRTTANFLLAFSAYNPKVRPYLKRYFKKTVGTPADWIDVAEIYQVFDDSTINFGSLPAVLRRALAAKFPDFDAYQLGKYRGTGGGAKKAKNKAKKKKRGASKSAPDAEQDVSVSKDKGQNDGGDDDAKLDALGSKLDAKISAMSQFGVASSDAPAVVPDKDDEEKDIERRTFTLKQLIRFLHVSQPAEMVMSLVGKKYPADEQAFAKSGLPGAYDSSRAAKRMKLPVPETWETQVAMKGNKAKTWEDLIDRKKLPFLATVRNLRNLILAGISKTHHTKVLRSLSSEVAVTRSKLPAFRFFTAFTVLDELKKKLMEVEKEQSKSLAEQLKKRRIMKRDPKLKEKKAALREQWWKKKQKKLLAKSRQLKYNVELISQYRKALDQAVMISTKQNVPPIPGKTLIFVNATGSMLLTCQSAKGFGKPKTLLDVGLLLGLMALYVCEDAKLYASRNDSSQPTELKLEPGSLLENLDRMLSICASNMLRGRTDSIIPRELLTSLLSKREKIDSIIVLSNGCLMTQDLEEFLTHYRTFVNPDFLYVGVNLSASKTSVSWQENGAAFDLHRDKNVLLSGFSEQLLRFLSERSGKSQLAHIERIDKKYELPPVPKPPLADSADPKHSVAEAKPLQAAGRKGWRTIRVFISSPFRDMHGERDLLGRFVFPELRDKARKLKINLVEVDLRWGVPEDEARSNRSLEMCLTEVAKSDLFIGILGERYGEVLDTYEGAWDTPELAWLKNVEPGKSLTELEMEYAVLAHGRDKYENKAFFFLRNSASLNSVPDAFRDHFDSSRNEDKEKLKSLKARIKKSGAEIIQNYPATFGGFVEDKPIMIGLDVFAQTVADCIWNALVRLEPPTEVSPQYVINPSNSEMFVGRTATLKDARGIITRLFRTGGVVVISGKPGLGKTAFMAELFNSMEFGKARTAYVGYFADYIFDDDDAAAASDGIVSNLWKQISRHPEMNGIFLEDEVDPHVLATTATTDVLRQRFPGFLAALAKAGRRLVIFLDGLDKLYDGDSAAATEGFDWLPVKLPEGVVVVLSLRNGSKVSSIFLGDGIGSSGSIMSTRKPQGIVTLGPLLVNERIDLVKNLLAKHGKTLSDTSTTARVPVLDWLFSCCQNAHVLASNAVCCSGGAPGRAHIYKTNQMRALISKKDAGNPMYLRLAVEEIRIFGVFEKLDEKLKKLGATIEGLFEEILRRLEAEFGVEEVSEIMSFLLVSKDGLLEDEIIDLMALSSADVVKHGPGQWATNIQEIYGNAENTSRGFGWVSRLLREVKHWLSQQGSSTNGATVFALKDGSLRAVARLRYFSAKGHDRMETRVREIMADYYQMKCWNNKAEALVQDSSPRDLMLVTYHLCLAGRFSLLADLFLCSLEFIERKATMGLLESLMEDYKSVASAANDGFLDKRKARERFELSNSERFHQFQDFVRRHLHTLKRAPGLTLQCALNEFDGSLLRSKAEESLRSAEKSVALTEWRSRPKRRADPCETVLTGFREPLLSCAVSLDGKIVAVGTDDGVVRLHDLSTTKEIASFVGHGSGVFSLCFVGVDRLCSGSDDGQLCMWDIDRQYRIHSIQGHGRRLAAIAVSPDFMSFITVGWDCKIKIWNSNDCREISCITHPLLPVSCVCHHPERNAIITGGWDATIRIWDTVTLKRIAILRGHAGSVRAIAISVCGLILASGSVDGTVKLWSSALGVEIGTFRTSGGSPINSVTFTADAKSVISAGVDGRVIVWPTNSCRKTKHYPLAFSQGVAIIQPNPSLTSAAVGFRDGKIRFYEFDGAGRAPRSIVTLGSTAVAGICHLDDVGVAAFLDLSNLVHLMRTSGPYVRSDVTELPAIVTSLARIGENWLAVGCADGMLRTFKIEWGSVEVARVHLTSFQLYHGDGPIVAIALSAGASWLATVSGLENGVKIWKNPAQEEAEKAATSETAPNASQKDLFHCELSNLHSDVVTCATWGRAFDKDVLVTGSADASVVIYSVEKNRVVFRLTGHATSIVSVKAQESYVLSCSTDGFIILWSLTGARIADYTTAAYSVPGFGLIFKSRTAEAQKLDWAEEVEQEEKEASAPPHRRRVMEDVEVEKAFLVTAGSAGLDILRMFQGREDCILTGHRGAITGLAAVAAVPKVVSAGFDRTIRLWNLDACKELTNPQGDVVIEQFNQTCSPHESAITQIVLFEAWDLVITGDRDGKLVLWETCGGTSQKELGVIGWEPVQVEKAHSLAITASTKLNGVGSKRFATGGLDGKVCVWLLKRSSRGVDDGGDAERLLKLYNPVWISFAQQVKALMFEPRQKLLFAALGPHPMVIIYSLETMTQRGVVRFPSSGFGQSASSASPCGFQFLAEQDMKLVCDSQCVREIKWKKSVVKTSNKEKGSEVKAFLSMTFGTSYPVPKKGIPCVFLAGFGNPRSVLVGDSSGFIHEAILHDPNAGDQVAELQWRDKKLHTSPINTLIPIKSGNSQFLISTADEPFLKIWRGRSVRDLVQVGQFECSAVLSSATVMKVTVSGAVHLTCADIWGAMHDFEIWLPTSSQQANDNQHSLVIQPDVQVQHEDMDVDDESDDDEADEQNKGDLVSEADDDGDDSALLGSLFD